MNEQRAPAVAACVYLAPTCIIEGNVTIGTLSSAWHYAVLRADFGHITVGQRSNLQEHVIVHMSPGSEVCIGNDVTIGHRATLHGCEIADTCLIGMGAIILNGARIGPRSIVAAGSVVRRGDYPSDSFIVGSEVRRQTRPEEQQEIRRNAQAYVDAAHARILTRR